MESLLYRMRQFTVFTPGIQGVVYGEAREGVQCCLGGARRNTVELRATEHLVSNSHRFLLHKLNLMLLFHHFTPGVDLVVNVDLHRADVGATAI